MSDIKDSSEEKNSSTEKSAENSASAQQQDKKAEKNEQKKKTDDGGIALVHIPDVTVDKQIDELSKNVETMKLQINKVETRNKELRISLRPNSSSLRKFASSDKDVKRVWGFEIKNNTRWLARAKPILDNIQKDLSLKIKNRKEALHESIKLEKARAPYYIKRNQYHIKQKLSKLLYELRANDVSKFRSLQRLAARRTKIHMEQFESEILSLVNEIDSDLYHKCVGVSEYKIKFINYIRDLLK